MLRRVLLSVVLLSLLLGASAHGGSDEGGDNEEPVNLRATSLIVVKVVCLIIAFVVTFIGGVSPYFLKWNEGFLLLGTQFAGGVFLGTSIMHFLSDANSTFEDLTSKEYPFAYMLACSGYLLTMLADCVVSYVYGKRTRDVDLEPHLHGIGNESNGKDDGKEISVRPSQDANLFSSLSKVSQFADTIMLIIALCFHSVFEGIAIGVSKSKGDAWKALWTISLHKIFAAIAMGIALLRMIPGRPLLSCSIYAFAFAISTPVGVAIGIIIDATTQGPVADWLFAISMGLACGVFIYVSINHLLSKGNATNSSGKADNALFRFIAVLLGVSVIAVSMIWDT